MGDVQVWMPDGESAAIIINTTGEEPWLLAESQQVDATRFSDSVSALAFNHLEDPVGREKTLRFVEELNKTVAWAIEDMCRTGELLTAGEAIMILDRLAAPFTNPGRRERIVDR